MMIYIKPEVAIKSFKSIERFTAQWSDIFGTGTDIPISAFTMGDDASIA